MSPEHHSAAVGPNGNDTEIGGGPSTVGEVVQRLQVGGHVIDTSQQGAC
jgi:hypothetical protein